MTENQQQVEVPQADPELITQLPGIELYKTMQVPLRYMRPSEYNPNELNNDDELLALQKSIQSNPEFFKARPVLLNAAEGREGIIIGGEKRFLAAKKLGWTSSPAMFVLAETLEKEKAWTILDNHHNGEVNALRKKDVFDQLHAAGYDLTSLGHTPMGVQDLMAGLPNLDKDEEDEEGAGSIPSRKWLECPACGHHAAKSDFIKVDPED